MYLGYILSILSIIWLVTVLFVRLPRNIVFGSFLIISSSILGFIFYKIGPISIIYFLTSLFILFCFLLSFYSNRVYNYLFAILFLILTPFFLKFKLDDVAEIFASIAFLFLVLGFVKDVLYEKFIKS